MTGIKLDENLGAHLLQRARQSGHDAESVRTQGLNGVADARLFEHCRTEGRILITLDLDFSNPLRFSPVGTAGTIILRPHRPSAAEIDSLFDETLKRLSAESVDSRIWIVEPGRIRIYWAWDADQEPMS